MKTNCGVLLLGICFGMIPVRVAAEEADLDWETELKRLTVAAQEDFATWKSTGNVPESFEDNAVRADRADLIERMLAGDRLAETEVKVDGPAVACEVTVRDRMPAVSAISEGSSYQTVWRRITKDRFEIWTPTEGRLYDAGGKLLATAKVRRGDGWGRQWYGAFLPDGSWVTTDLDERDDKLTMFSSKGKRVWSIKGGTLIPEDKDPDADSSLPLIAWSRSAKDGKAWVVSVGSEFGRGRVRVTPDGKWRKVESPWKECLPQQLGPRGMYTSKYVMSDDGSISISRHEPSHGVFVGWPVYQFPGELRCMIPGGEKFGILPDAWSAYVEANYHGSDSLTESSMEDRQKERVWFFDAKGKFQRWITGHGAGSSLASGSLWVVLPDYRCVRVDKGFSVGSHRKFVIGKEKLLMPVEIHEDIHLGLFRQEDKLVLGSWE